MTRRQDTVCRTCRRHQAAVMPVKMNAISSHQKWCQSGSREVGSKCKQIPQLQLGLRLQTPVVILVNYELCIAISNRSNAVARLSSSSLPPFWPDIPCNPSHGKCDQHQDEVLDHNKNVDSSHSTHIVECMLCEKLAIYP